MNRWPKRRYRRSIWIDVALSVLALVLVHTFLVTLPSYLVDSGATMPGTALEAPTHGAVHPVETARSSGSSGGGATSRQAPAAPRN